MTLQLSEVVDGDDHRDLPEFEPTVFWRMVGWSWKGSWLCWAKPICVQRYFEKAPKRSLRLVP